MSDSMIERIARLLSPPLSPEAAREKARAAIEAMREPTEAMAEAGGRYCHPDYMPGGGADAWRDAIDAALSEKP